ncbi:universal stress protein [Acidothermaceae bacterium B102]|nr:universal stress protein [Acidothermaceae bacterium B102]
MDLLTQHQDEQAHLGIRSIVVGVDESAASLHALRWAAHLAAALGARITAVEAHKTPAVYTLASDAAAVEASETTLRETVAGFASYGVAIDSRVAPGSPGVVLVDASKDADLLVVGSDSRGLLPDPTIVSISMHCLRHAYCPVVVVPTPKGDEA